MNVSKTSGSTCSSSRKLVILPVFVIIAAAVIVLELRVIVSVIRSINLLKGFKPFMWELGELQHDIRLQLQLIQPTIFDYLENARKFLAELTTLFGKWFYNNHFYYYLLQNFLALCASNYYDNCIFHRWVGRNSQKRYTCMSWHEPSQDLSWKNYLEYTSFNFLLQCKLKIKNALACCLQITTK